MNHMHITTKWLLDRSFIQIRLVLNKHRWGQSVHITRTQHPPRIELASLEVIYQTGTASKPLGYHCVARHRESLRYIALPWAAECPRLAKYSLLWSTPKRCLHFIEKLASHHRHESVPYHPHWYAHHFEGLEVWRKPAFISEAHSISAGSTLEVQGPQCQGAAAHASTYRPSTLPPRAQFILFTRRFLHWLDLLDPLRLLRAACSSFERLTTPTSFAAGIGFFTAPQYLSKSARQWSKLDSGSHVLCSWPKSFHSTKYWRFLPCPDCQ